MDILLLLLWLALGWIGAAAFWADIQRPEWLWMAGPSDVLFGLGLMLTGPVAFVASTFTSGFWAHGLKFIPHWSPPE